MKKVMKSVTLDKAYELDSHATIESMSAKFRDRAKDKAHLELAVQLFENVISTLTYNLHFISKKSVIFESSCIGEEYKDTVEYDIDSNTINMILPDHGEFVLRYDVEKKLLTSEIDSTLNIVFRLKE